MPPIRHLYIHIPFCLKVCPYCSFYKEVADGRQMRRFVDALLLELERETARLAEGTATCAPRRLQPRTIFLGGGTPSALSVRQLDALLTGLRERLDLGALEEWTLEMNPATISAEKARLLRGLGVNRVSMGVQSWDDGLLRVLGRVHTAGQARRSWEILRGAGFENINLDLMFAIPTQTLAQWEATLAESLALGPEHLSAYCLTYEEDTEFFRRFTNGEWTQSREWDADLFELTLDRLGVAGYVPYEISNHAKPGRECLHNLAYWEGADYLGLGPGAFSTVGGGRWQNLPQTAAYIAAMQAGRRAVGFAETLDAPTRRAEQIAFGLRTNRGVETAWLTPWPEVVAEYLAEGFIEPVAAPASPLASSLPAPRLRLTRKGVLVADALAEAFV